MVFREVFIRSYPTKTFVQQDFYRFYREIAFQLDYPRRNLFGTQRVPTFSWSHDEPRRNVLILFVGPGDQALDPRDAFSTRYRLRSISDTRNPRSLSDFLPFSLWLAIF